jgi:hypothetical protein
VICVLLIWRYADPYIWYAGTFDWRNGVSCGFLLVVLLVAFVIARLTRTNRSS